MPKPERELVLAGRAALTWVRTGELPPAGLMADDRRPYSGLPGVKGGSANLGLVAHFLGLIRGLPSSRDYFVARLTDCLLRGLQGGEQLSGYGDLHTAGEALAWWNCWRTGDSELGSLLGASLERTALLQCLCGRLLPSGDLQLLAPGMRFDRGGPGRETESAMWARLLETGGNKLKVREEEGKTWAGGLFLQALREAEGVGLVLRHTWGDCVALLHRKIDPAIGIHSLPSRLSQARLWCPITVEVYSKDDFFAYLLAPPGQTHPQDPAMPGGGVVNGGARVLWPWAEGEDPGEGGWTVGVRHDTGSPNAGFTSALWTRGANTWYSEVALPPTTPLLRLTFGPEGVEGLPTADPMGDLPPLPPPPENEPRKPGPKPTPEPPPPEEGEPMPEPTEPLVPPGSITATDIRKLSGPTLRALGQAVAAAAYSKAAWGRVHGVWMERAEPEIAQRRSSSGN